MLRSQRRAFVSPDPVARRHPVGENEAQRIGEVCPEFNIDIRNLLVSIIKVKVAQTGECRGTSCGWTDAKNTLR